MRVEHSIDIDAPVSKVWGLTVDVEDWPEHTPTMDRVEKLDDGPLEVGSQARIKQPGQSEKVWTITELEPEKVFTWSSKVMGMTMSASHRLEKREGDTTRNTLSVEATGGLTAILGGLLKKPIGKAIARENEGFKAAAES